MRKFVFVAFVLFTASVFAISGVAQRRGRRRGRGGGSMTFAADTAEPPNSPQIAQEMGGLHWGVNHNAVVDYFAQQIRARYEPQMRNLGQIEQDRLMQTRDAEIDRIRQSYTLFAGLPAQRRWDTSYIADEYTHNNGESMIVREDRANNLVEFFFFFNDHLWKRYQNRTLAAGAQIDFPTFAAGLEQLFGPGLHRMRGDAPDQLETVMWQDETTRLRVVDNTAFYGAFGLVYEERATLGRLAELRHNAPTKTVGSTGTRPPPDEPQVGNVDSDPNSDIVDRVTGKMRHVQANDGGTP